MNGNPEPYRRVRRQGPATLRGKNIPQTTTDQRLLDRRGPSDWVHTDPWRVLRIQAEFVEGFGLLAELGPAVAIFGSARTGRGSREYDIAERTAAGLVRAGYAVITGGGPGIMEAANRGAWESGAKSVGLNITLPHEQDPNPYITPELCFQFHYFSLRKMHFLMRAKALVACPGGYGTLDELFETLTLVQTGKKRPLPIVLFGKEFWKRTVDFDYLAEQGMIAYDDVKLVKIVETAEEGWEHIRTFWKAHRGTVPAE
jgi:uncharacterized protein (TIGR00730 family)